MDEQAAQQKAIDLLARREHSRQELEKKLQLRGVSDEVIAHVLDELVEKGWQSDERYIEQYIHTRLRRGFGILRILGELCQRGIGESLAKQCMEQIDINWEQRITEVRIKKFGVALPSDWNDRVRQVRFLQQRGFTHEQIQTELDAE